MSEIKWGVIGPGNIAHRFAKGLSECKSGKLWAVAGRNAERRHAFADQFGVDETRRFEHHADMLASDIDAVYIATPHPLHAEFSIQAIRAKKHVLCEKPAGLTEGEIASVVNAAQEHDVFFMEAVMYRCHPQIARLREIIERGDIGTIEHVDVSFGFEADYDPQSRLFNPDMAGGAIYDVGIYPISFARLIAGFVHEKGFMNPVKLSGLSVPAPTGVDATAFAHLLFEGDITATCSTSVLRDMASDVTIFGTLGQINLPDPWTPGRDAGPSDCKIMIITADGVKTEMIKDKRMLFAHEAEAVSMAIGSGQKQGPVTWQDSLGNAQTIDLWRAACQ
jgi:predicted dehydrogenase